MIDARIKISLQVPPLAQFIQRVNAPLSLLGSEVMFINCAITQNHWYSFLHKLYTAGKFIGLQRELVDNKDVYMTKILGSKRFYLCRVLTFV